jgi:hypothetical protein
VCIGSASFTRLPRYNTEYEYNPCYTPKSCDPKRSCRLYHHVRRLHQFFSPGMVHMGATAQHPLRLGLFRYPLQHGRMQSKIQHSSSSRRGRKSSRPHEESASSALLVALCSSSFNRSSSSGRSFSAGASSRHLFRAPGRKIPSSPDSRSVCICFASDRTRYPYGFDSGMIVLSVSGTYCSRRRVVAKYPSWSFKSEHGSPTRPQSSANHGDCQRHPHLSQD